jgi:signal peptidase II
VQYGAVADFLDFHFRGTHFPAFNVADSLICIGIFVLLIRKD